MSYTSRRVSLLVYFNERLGRVKREIGAENRMTDRSPTLQTRLGSGYAVGEGQMDFNVMCLFLPLFFFDT